MLKKHLLNENVASGKNFIVILCDSKLNFGLKTGEKLLGKRGKFKFSRRENAKVLYNFASQPNLFLRCFKYFSFYF